MDHQHITRRQALVGAVSTASAAVLALATVPGAIAATPEPASEIMRLFGEWDACYKGTWGVDSDEESNAVTEKMWSLEAAMMPLPASTAAEFAAKLIAATNYGDWIAQDSLMAEAVALCGGAATAVSRSEVPPAADSATQIEAMPASSRANYHQTKLAEALCEMSPGKWRTATSKNNDFLIVVRDEATAREQASVFVQYLY